MRTRASQPIAGSTVSNAISVSSTSPASSTSSTSSTSSDGSLYTIEDVQGKGHGCVAAQEISVGTCVVREPAFLTLEVDPTESFEPAQRQKILSRLAEATEPAQTDFWTLHNSHVYEKDYDTLRGILVTNAFNLDDDGTHGLFRSISRFNHACIPNAQTIYNWQTKEMTIHAVTCIPAGEEITISYSTELLKHDERQQHYLKGWGFICTCDLCSLNEEDRAAADRLITSIGDIEGTEPAKCPNLGRCNCEVKLRTIYDALHACYVLGKIDSSWSDRFECAANIVRRHGDLVRCKMLYNFALNFSEVCRGELHPATVDLERELSKLDAGSEPVSWSRMRQHWKTSVDEVPEGLARYGSLKWALRIGAHSFSASPGTQ